MALTRTYYSTDAGAPVLRGVAGDAVALLDAILVNGYNSKTGLAITRTSSTATVTKTAHGYRTGQIVRIAGASQTEYNGDFRVTVVDADTFTYAVSGSPASPATGSITSVVAPLDWTKPYSGTNKAVYRSPSGTNQFYYRMDHASSAQQARLRGYETMSDVDTGTGDFPTVAQLANSVFLYVSSTPDTTARPWYAISDGKVVYLMSDYSSTSSTGCAGLMFGDIAAKKAGDLFCSVACGSNGTLSTALVSPFGASPPSNPQHYDYVARTTAGTGSSVRCAKVVDFQANITITLGAGVQSLSSSHHDGNVYFSSVRLMESDSLYRADFQGLWAPCHNARIFTHLSEFAGDGQLAGKTLKAFNVYPIGQVCFEISDNWDS